MKKSFTVVYIISAFLLVGVSFAQSRYVAEDSWAFGFGFTYPRYIAINDAVVTGSSFYGGHISIQRNFSENIGLRLRGAYNHVEATWNPRIFNSSAGPGGEGAWVDSPLAGQTVENNMITAVLDLIYYFVPCEPWAPYLIGGTGINFHKPENALDSGLNNKSFADGQFNIGTGTEIRISSDWRAKLEVSYNFVWSGHIDGRLGPSSGLIGGQSDDTWVQADFGLVYYFSKGEPSRICDLYTGIEAVDYDKV